MRVAGIDGCKAGWVAVVLDPEVGPASARVLVEATLTDLMVGQSIDFGLVDMPIGLSSQSSLRRVEASARERLGSARRSSVFDVPCRAAIESSTRELANEVNRATVGSGVGSHSWALVEKIREVDSAVRKLGQTCLREGHPEVSFAIMRSGEGLAASKTSPRGLLQRWRLLEDIGFSVANLAENTPHERKVAMDDLIDAIALSWSALRVHRKAHQSFPRSPQRDDCGLEMAIWA